MFVSQISDYVSLITLTANISVLPIPGNGHDVLVSEAVMVTI